MWRDWADYTRYHSSLLFRCHLQFSRELVVPLKHGVKAEMAKRSLCGTIQHLANVVVQWNRKANKRGRMSNKKPFGHCLPVGNEETPLPCSISCLSREGSEHTTDR